MAKHAPATLSSFPKQRPPLEGEYAAIYDAYYEDNRQGRTPASSLSQLMERWLHRQVAADVRVNPPPGPTLEIGAGTLNQLAFEPENAAYDVVEPFTRLLDAAAGRSRVRHVYEDIADVPATARYARVTSVAAFEHIENLPEVVARAGLMLLPGGALRVSIPSEGSPLWGLGWRLTTGLEFRLKRRLDYGVLMRHEHVNTAREIEDVLRYFFDTVRSRFLGLTPGFSLYRFFACTDPDAALCSAYLCSPGPQEGRAV